MASQFSTVNQTTRELFTSADFNRTQTLASAQLQDLLRDSSTGRESISSELAAQNPAPVQYQLLAQPTLTLSGADLTVTCSTGQALWYDTGVFGTTDYPYSETSDELVVRWRDTGFTLTPDAVNPRIARIYVTRPTAQVTDDPQARTTLLDPAPAVRSTAVVVVNKLSIPEVTPAIVYGAAAASPAPPAIPANSICLFELYIPAASLTSSLSKVARQAFKRIEYPGTTMHGVLSGCELRCPIPVAADESATSLMSFASSGILNRAVINGELISFFPDANSIGSPSANDYTAQFQRDTANNPFGAAAPVNSDQVYYIYLCGGRGLLQGSLGGTIGGKVTWNPIIVVESTVAPTGDGYASGTLTTTRGVIPATSALFIGLGAKIKNTTLRKAASYGDGWYRPLLATSALFPTATVTTGLNDNATIDMTAAAPQTGAITTLPSVNSFREAEVTVVVGIAAPGVEAFHGSIGTAPGAGTAADFSLHVTNIEGVGNHNQQSRIFSARALVAASYSFTRRNTVVTGGGSAYLYVTALKMNIPRIVA